MANYCVLTCFFLLRACSTSPPSSNLVDSLLLVAHNNESGEKVGNAERQTMWGNCGFNWRVLGLHLPDLDKILYRHTLGGKERSCVSPMSVIIMGAEIC